ncbi:MAG: ATP-binding protein [Bacteroidia bacterium]|nr:ATP-binding protein [Bacteroidia bacterium]
MKVLLFWSSGKDSAWTLYKLRRKGYPVAALLTTTTPDHRVPFHEVEVGWVRAQAVAASLPLWEVPLPPFCSNAVYEQIVGGVLIQARQQGFTHVAFGDLYLEDIRRYREQLVEKYGLVPLFPIWTGSPLSSGRLARTMLRFGLRAVVTWADPQYFPAFSPGQPFDQAWLQRLPDGVDPCGERGEFHTFCYAGPMFYQSLKLPLKDGSEGASWMGTSHCCRPLL